MAGPGRPSCISHPQSLLLTSLLPPVPRAGDPACLPPPQGAGLPELEVQCAEGLAWEEGLALFTRHVEGLACLAPLTRGMKGSRGG